MKTMINALLCILIIFPTVAQAEVSDKIWSVSGMWQLSIIVGAILMAGSYWKWPVVLAALLVSFVMASGVYDMAADKFMSQAVIAEQGPDYFVNGYLSAALVPLLALLGAFAKRMLRER